MATVYAYKTMKGQSANIDQLPLQRSWMDETFDRHSYHCFPMTLSNRLGWGISLNEDVSFIWDGTTNSTPDHVTITQGDDVAYPGRGNATVSFRTNLVFDSEENVSLLTMPVPNQFIRGAQCLTTLISSSVLQGDFPVAWMITEPNREITIPAGTIICAVLPISLTEVQSNELVVRSGGAPYMSDAKWNFMQQERGRVSQEKNKAGEWTHFYRDAVNPDGTPSGKHETKKIVMKVTDESN